MKIRELVKLIENGTNYQIIENFMVVDVIKRDNNSEIGKDLLDKEVKKIFKDYEYLCIEVK